MGGAIVQTLGLTHPERVKGIVLVGTGARLKVLPLILDGGLNGLLPFEVAAGNDLFAARRKYGKNLILFGGIDKRNLRKDKKAIDQELESKKGLIDEGGYILTVGCDFSKNVPLENMKAMMSFRE
jgi:uroporphyrinogen decarboxylase